MGAGHLVLTLFLILSVGALSSGYVLNIVIYLSLYSID